MLNTLPLAAPDGGAERWPDGRPRALPPAGAAAGAGEAAGADMGPPGPALGTADWAADSEPKVSADANPAADRDQCMGNPPDSEAKRGEQCPGGHCRRNAPAVARVPGIR